MNPCIPVVVLVVIAVAILLDVAVCATAAMLTSRTREDADSSVDVADTQALGH